MPAHKNSPLRYCLLFCLLLSGPALVHTHAGAAAIETFTPQTNSFSFSLPDLSDTSHSLSDYHGKVVLVNFWASWCPPCIHEMPALQKLKQGLAGKPFEILTLNVGEKKYKVMKFAKLINLELPVLLDTNNDTFNAWQVKTLPTSYLIDTTGTVRYRVIGNPGWDDTETTNLINKLLAETLNTTGMVK